MSEAALLGAYATAAIKGSQLAGGVEREPNSATVTNAFVLHRLLSAVPKPADTRSVSAAGSNEAFGRATYSW
jgi:hypothetical protein